jgi:hypothetical protein
VVCLRRIDAVQPSVTWGYTRLHMTDTAGGQGRRTIPSRSAEWLGLHRR